MARQLTWLAFGFVLAPSVLGNSFEVRFHRLMSLGAKVWVCVPLLTNSTLAEVLPLGEWCAPGPCGGQRRVSVGGSRGTGCVQRLVVPAH